MPPNTLNRGHSGLFLPEFRLMHVNGKVLLWSLGGGDMEGMFLALLFSLTSPAGKGNFSSESIAVEKPRVASS